MKRLTMDNVEEMGMYELSHNCCYIDKDGFVRYRDFRRMLMRESLCGT